MKQTEEPNLSELLLTTFRSPSYKPPALPEVASEVLRLCREKSTSIQQFTELLERDQLIAGRVLQIANSPFYSPVRHSDVGSLHRAVVRLGMVNLRNIVMELWLNLRVFRSVEYTDLMRRLSRHSSVTAYATNVVAKHACLDSEVVFLCGLMHDVGLAGALSVLSEAPFADRPLGSTDLNEELGLVHEDLSGIMIELWKLPEPIRVAVTHHHMVQVDGQPNLLAAMVCTAEDLANQLGFSVDLDIEATAGRLDAPIPGVVAAAWEALNLDPGDQERIHTEVEEIVERLSWLG